MSDNEIREILIERKKMQRRQERLDGLRDAAEGFIGFACLFILCFMIAVIGG